MRSPRAILSAVRATALVLIGPPAAARAATRAQKFTWNADGTPNFGSPVGLGVALPVPSGE
ncbi:hypothetical protein [Actinoplanes subtropicus]|uniref:hypothetical protein n=1 Tax=Actinoplanes subtropicus TaxID=543632 RepID=UPI0004C36ACC|nr:hypothetical protein [Actinoplanes subtropicus]